MSQPGEKTLTLASLSGEKLDDCIGRMARRNMGQVVCESEKMHRMIVDPHCAGTAADFLVSRLFTDAVFNADIRAIQLIINRIDGGLPKDYEVDDFKTEFADCLSEVMEMTSAAQTQVHPEDTVMMALCKSLYDLATQDIYWNEEKGQPIKRPSTDKKQERDTAMRMILERVGGRRTTARAEKEHDEIETASWIGQLGSGDF